MSTLVYLGLGSNHERELNLQYALDFLCALLSDGRCSPVYASAPMGVRGRAFFNLVMCGKTDLSLEQLSRLIKRFESKYLRRCKPYLVMPIDIDVLLYGRYVGEFKGGVLPRRDLVESPYVMLPISMLAPHDTHPLSGMTFSDIWRAFEHQVARKNRPVMVKTSKYIRMVLPAAQSTQYSDLAFDSSY
ncbi:2-amino-4-hydroxy-6-hydroxymethyldihydropteridine diphosphokinase [Pseudomonas sp. PvP001]|uniref:2-amino-4-hydroxy-6- hydroxymethyldihydropteridine diphosphokinase n=1 Tax=Pseudomonas sp. PvP001 TaxID=3158559 RepID=UPI003391F8C5